MWQTKCPVFIGIYLFLSFMNKDKYIKITCKIMTNCRAWTKETKTNWYYVLMTIECAL